MNYVIVVQEPTAMCSTALVHSQYYFGSDLESSPATTRNNWWWPCTAAPCCDAIYWPRADAASVETCM